MKLSGLYLCCAILCMTFASCARPCQHFTPTLTLRNPHLQTLLSYTTAKKKDPGSITQFVTLEDGDQITLEITQPSNDQAAKKIALLMPGTGGSHASPYLIRIAQRLNQENIGVARLNFRGMATAVGRAKKISHGGSTEDVLAALRYLRSEHPDVEIIAAGFSLSGNTLLKLAGEQDLSDYVSKIIAVCPPVNLSLSSQKIEKLPNRIYLNSMLGTIKEVVTSEENSFEYQPTQSVTSCRTLKDFDDLYTAPSSGFKDAQDYYEKSSSLNVIENINVPCHILFAKDDPLIDYQEIAQKKLPSNIELIITEYGGHMGFLRHWGKNRFWMDDKVIEWIKSHPSERESVQEQK